MRNNPHCLGLRVLIATLSLLAITTLTLMVHPSRTAAQECDCHVLPFIKQEQRQIRYRDPSDLPSVPFASTPPPPTVRFPLPEAAQRTLPLDEALRMALDNSEVIRRLAGVIAVSSGQTIYDPAIANTLVDQQRAAFDPVLSANNNWSQTERAVAVPDPGDPTQTVFAGSQTANHNVTLGLSQKNLTGGTGGFGFSNDATQFSPGLSRLNPQNDYATSLSYTQPLLRGAGVCANRVPIVLARIDTERSFFQFRDSIQELVRGTIEAYWSVVFARTDVWARGIQVQQAEELAKFSSARFKTGFADITETAQAETALAQFRAGLISAKANLLSREAALQNILGLPPTTQQSLVPTTPPTNERIDFDWPEIVAVAEQRRPDIVELKLILEADRQRQLLAENNTRAQVDLVGLYRWNGLEGETPAGNRIATRGGEETDWALGVNFSVPLILRQERANLRSSCLIVARDRAILEQGVHSAQHILALSFRNLDTFYAQYEAFQLAREAAQKNLNRQFAAYRAKTPVLFLNVLQAISDWGNSVSQEAQALTQYNTELATIERETGTILETHGIFFFEDRFCSLGPLWLNPRYDQNYPRDVRPGPNRPRYDVDFQPAENFFNLDDYPRRLPSTEDPTEDLDGEDRDDVRARSPGDYDLDRETETDASEDNDRETDRGSEENGDLEEIGPKRRSTSLLHMLRFKK